MDSTVWLLKQVSELQLTSGYCLVISAKCSMDFQQSGLLLYRKSEIDFCDSSTIISCRL